MSKNAKIYTIFKNTDREFTGTKKEISEYFNINYYTLINRINEQNMTLEEAISIKKCHNSSHLGETKLMNCGMKATIIEYFSPINITVKFEDGTIVKNKQYNNFKKYSISNPNLNYFTIYKGTDKEFISTLKQISDHFNLNYGNLKNRIYSKYDY